MSDTCPLVPVGGKAKDLICQRQPPLGARFLRLMQGNLPLEPNKRLPEVMNLALKLGIAEKRAQMRHAKPNKRRRTRRRNKNELTKRQKEGHHFRACQLGKEEEGAEREGTAAEARATVQVTHLVAPLHAFGGQGW